MFRQKLLCFTLCPLPLTVFLLTVALKIAAALDIRSSYLNACGAPETLHMGKKGTLIYQLWASLVLSKTGVIGQPISLLLVATDDVVAVVGHLCQQNKQFCFFQGVTCCYWRSAVVFSCLQKSLAIGRLYNKVPVLEKLRVVVLRWIKTGKIWGVYPLIQGLELTGSEESDECCCDTLPFYMNKWVFWS